MIDSAIKIPKINGGTPEISMAPLVDVIFLLLIFFMVTTVFPENRGIEIEKPSSEHSQPLPLKKVTFTLTNDNKILFRNKSVETNDITRIVAERINAEPDIAILLQIDKLATAQHIISVMDACKSGGAERIGIATKKQDAGL